MVGSPPIRRDSIVGRVRSASYTVLNSNVELGAWQAAGTAIGRAPDLNELRRQGTQPTLTNPFRTSETVREEEKHHGRSITEQPQSTTSSLPQQQEPPPKANWRQTIVNALIAFWNFFKTPKGFIITIYCLNIVGWGAMLFFLLLKAAPAMNYPTADDDNSPRKKWLEISSQILNALFCVTGFGLAPWRFRDMYLYIRAVGSKHLKSMRKLAEQNRSWFRPPHWATADGDGDEAVVKTTVTGRVAPPTPLWKLGFTIVMMVANTFLQAVLCYFMWGFNRFDRPGWATGTFIGLGCGVAMLAGLMSFWEGRRVKKIEGGELKVTTEAPPASHVS